jgi:hypothetical protein
VSARWKPSTVNREFPLAEFFLLGVMEKLAKALGVPVAGLLE